MDTRDGMNGGKVDIKTLKKIVRPMRFLYCPYKKCQRKTAHVRWASRSYKCIHCGFVVKAEE